MRILLELILWAAVAFFCVLGWRQWLRRPVTRELVGRVACFCGFHSWEARSEFTRTTIITLNRCTRSRCPRYAEERIVNLERRVNGSGCSCRKGAWDPSCLVHGRQVA